MNLGYHLARTQGALTRAVYKAALPAITRRALTAGRRLSFDVFSYSGEAALPEQVASIRSLLRYAGRPNRFVVVSDGTYSTGSRRLLERIDPVVSVQDSRDRSFGDVPRSMESYLRQHPTGKQLALIMALPEDRPALYIDSDVMFFPGSARLATVVEETVAPARYLADCQLSADERLLHPAERAADPVNTGVLLLRGRLDWSDSINRFMDLDGEPTFFTNQSMTHLTMHRSGADAFDREDFVLQLDDQFAYGDRYAADELVLRHYVNPVRHKFWTSFGLQNRQKVRAIAREE